METIDQETPLMASVNEDSDFDVIRSTEFSRLGDSVYVDHAGAALYSESQLQNVFKDLSRHVLGNPHSQHSGPLAGPDAEATGRRLTLEMCNASASEYDCIFTSGATGAMKIVAETFPWAPGSTFAHTADNHTSVLGMREVATHAGATTRLLDPSPIAGFEEPARAMVQESATTAHHLFAYPLESNFSGARYPLHLTTTVQSGGNLDPPGTAQEGAFSAREDASGAGPCMEVAGAGRRWWVLLDSAKACSTCPPDLSIHKPDFVALSYYKIFGYPTGLGALLVRKDASRILRRRYFGGGTVLACSAETDFVRRREGPAGFEDGTNSYLGIAALPHGFALIERLGGFPAIQKRTASLTRRLVGELKNLRHFNNQPACELYGNHASRGVAAEERQWAAAVGQGPTIALNLLRQDGSYVGYREVERLAGLSGIMLRGGCFCNPGACARHLGLSSSDIQENFEAGKVCWDDNDLVHGRPTGAIRLSFGAASAPSDCAALLAFFRRHFVQATPPPQPLCNAVTGTPEDSLRLEGIWVYPIKSCRGCLQEEWSLGPNGLLFDREWALVGEGGKVLTLKKHPRLATIRPQLDLDAGVMRVSAVGMSHALTIELPPASTGKAGKQAAGPSQQIRLCAESVTGMKVGPAPMRHQQGPQLSPLEWFSQAVGERCSLVQQQAGTRQAVTRGRMAGRQMDKGATAGDCQPPPIGFANEAQILLTNTASLEDLNARLLAGKGGRGSAPQAVDMERFRPNLVVSGGAAFCEDAWDSLVVGGSEFQVAGPCARCEVVCHDPEKGSRQGAEPLLTLASYRRTKGQINFGVLLQLSSQHTLLDGWPTPKLTRGMEVTPLQLPE